MVQRKPDALSPLEHLQLRHFQPTSPTSSLRPGNLSVEKPFDRGQIYTQRIVTLGGQFFA